MSCASDGLTAVCEGHTTALAVDTVTAGNAKVFTTAAT